jgi:hypothetical protein
MAAVIYNIKIEAETTIDENRFYILHKSAGQPTDLNGCHAEMDIRETLSGESKLRLSTENGGLVVNDLPGRIYIRMTRIQTANLELKKNRGVYDLLLLFPGGHSKRLVQGSVIVSPAVTRD